MHKCICVQTHMHVFLYIYNPYRMQGIGASLFCTNGELQNSCEHCGRHAEKVFNITLIANNTALLTALAHWNTFILDFIKHSVLWTSTAWNTHICLRAGRVWITTCWMTFWWKSTLFVHLSINGTSLFCNRSTLFLTCAENI